MSGLDITENRVNLKEGYNSKNLNELLLTNILTKYNIYYEKYLENIKPKKYKSNNNNKTTSKNNLSNTNNINLHQNNPLGNNSKDNNTNENNPPPNNNNNINAENNTISKKYINSQLYPIIRNYRNANLNNITIYKTNGNGNCLFRAFAYFINNDETNYKKMRMIFIKKDKIVNF